MGFRKGAFAKIWTVESLSDTMTKSRISISRKEKSTGEYVQDFGGYVAFVGSAAAKKALALKPGDRIRLGDVDVDNKYVKEKNITYTNYKVFSFDSPDEIDSPSGEATPQAMTPGNPFGDVDSGEIDDSSLPF